MMYLIFLLSLVSISIVAEIAAKRVPVICGHNAKSPAEADLKQKYKEWLGEGVEMHPSIQLLPGVFQQIKINEEKNADNTRNDDKRFFIGGDRNCSRTMSNNRTDGIHDRSTCPWYFLLSYDENRFPRNMVTARCRCNKSCYMQRYNRKKCRSSKCKENISSPQCVEIPYQYKVLKQKYDINNNKLCDEKGNFIFVKTYETFAVGCTCAVPFKDMVVSGHTFVTEI